MLPYRRFDTNDLSKTKPAGVFQSNRIQPELRLFGFAFDVNVR